MDKSWMSKNRLSREYLVGVESFIAYATKDSPTQDKISCPCTECGNLVRQTVLNIRLHLLMNGIDQTYHRWIWHGEVDVSSHSMEYPDQMQHEFGSEDLVEMVHAAYEKGSDNPADFIQLVEDAEKPLYSGCLKFSKLSAIVKLYNLKAKHSWSDRSFTDLLALLGEMLPQANELPLSLYEARKSLVSLGMTYEKIHACPNDCILYRKEYEDLHTCPTCGASRWKESNKSKSKNSIPAKVLWYFPPIPRFQRMFRNKDLARDLTWHHNKRLKDGLLRHPADSPSWRIIDHKWPDFASDSRNLRLALSADGINLHSLMASNYSCWPVLLVTYNLPPWVCMKRKFMMLTLLISGPKQPGNDIDVYLAPLIDDLKLLWLGIPSYDAYMKEHFQLKAVLLWTINDFPAYGNLSGCKVKGYCGCPICCECTYARRLKHSRKMSYTGHRRFLPDGHPYRRQKKAFDGTQEFNTAPKPLNGHDVLNRVSDIKCIWGKLSQSKKVGDKAMWKKKSIFFELEYWEHLHVRHILDVMHIEKNICESLIGTLLDIPGKTKDGIASRKDLADMNIRSELTPVVEEKRTYLPPACYTLSRAEKRSVCETLSSVKVPTGYSSNVSKLVSLKELKLIGLKSHDCHTLMQQLLPVTIRGVLPEHVRSAITRLCFFFNMLCSKVIDVNKLHGLQEEIVTTLCLLEKYFPPSFFDIMVHLAIHLVREVKLCGPVWYRWMYPFERYMRVLKGYVRNRNRPEGCIAECYIAEEAMEYCSDYLSDVQTCGIPTHQHSDQPTRHLSSARGVVITKEELEQAHLYVLANEADIDPYTEEHMRYLKTTSLSKAKSHTWLQRQHNRLFPDWLRERVQNDSKASERLKLIAEGPSIQVLKYDSYKVNGVTFYTRKLDEGRTVQNSGVSIVAKTMQIASAKDKNPIVSDMVFYGVIEDILELDYTKERVLMFKCNWVDNKSAVKMDDYGFTIVNLAKIGFKDDSFILASQAKQVFYVDDPKNDAWSVVLATPPRDFFDNLSEGDFEEQVLHHGPKKLSTNSDDIFDEDESYVRSDCDGTWIEHEHK